EVFTTRIDTIYGVSFMVLAPEHEWVDTLTTSSQKAEIEAYKLETQKRSELDRMSDVKTVSGAFTGSYCVNPVNGEQVSIWIADYVLAGYGTGAVMAVPCGDQRDWNFAKHFNLPIPAISDVQVHLDEAADASKEGKYINSGMIDGMGYQEAVDTLINWIEENKAGKGKVNFRLRDAVFARQRYWGEPVPVYFKENGLPYLVDESDLPIILPEIDEYKPTETGEPPLGRAKDWKYKDKFDFEMSTMPGWAGSSWYWYRYMDAKNDNAFASKEALDYWEDVDLYVGGTEHATGHLLYSRFWNKFLKDKGFVKKEEFAKKLLNQGMIQGVSAFVYGYSMNINLGSSDLAKIPDGFKILPKLILPKSSYDNFKKGVKDDILDLLISKHVKTFKEIGIEVEIKQELSTFFPLHVDIELVNPITNELNLEEFKVSNRYKNLLIDDIITDDGGKYICGSEVEKMSKSKFNVVNPDTLVERYGADTLRLYEMFLGPLTEAKPWDTKGIEGTYRFLKKLWKLFFDQDGNSLVIDEKPSSEELKALHKAIKKVGSDIENFSFNTSVSTFMICVNELTDLNCHKKDILNDLMVILSPYAPHVAEELWAALGNKAGSVTSQTFPDFNEEYLKEDSIEYPIQIGGKVRVKLSFPAETSKKDIEEAVLANQEVIKWMDGKPLRKIIVVPKRIVNVVI
ncbi:MAG: leucyl-tRNA synthetase, partial [Algoriphagus sp.]